MPINEHLMHVPGGENYHKYGYLAWEAHVYYVNFIDDYSKLCMDISSQEEVCCVQCFYHFLEIS
jgi:hypothetical protein